MNDLPTTKQNRGSIEHQKKRFYFLAKANIWEHNDGQYKMLFYSFAAFLVVNLYRKPKKILRNVSNKAKISVDLKKKLNEKNSIENRTRTIYFLEHQVFRFTFGQKRKNTDRKICIHNKCVTKHTTNKKEMEKNAHKNNYWNWCNDGEHMRDDRWKIKCNKHRRTSPWI